MAPRAASPDASKPASTPALPVAAATGRVESLPSGRLHLGIDYGTSSIVVSYRFHTSSGTLGRIYTVRTKGNIADIPSHVAYQGGEFVWGHELTDRLTGKGKAVDAQNVMRHVKLLLYEPSTEEQQDEDDEVPQMQKVLKRTTSSSDQVFSDHLKSIVACVKAHIGSNSQINYTADAVRAMPIDARISIPQTGTPATRKRMMKAAQGAGVTTAVLVSEPQCVLARYLEIKAKDGLPLRLKAGDHIAVLDFGGGTGDFIKYRLDEDLADNSRLSAVHQSRGAVCGSYKVSQSILKGMGDLGQDRIALGLGGVAESAFRWSMLKGIEEVKVKAPLDLVNIITPWNYSTSTRGKIYMISRADIENAHIDSIEAIHDRVNPLMAAPAPTLTIVAGGFSKSEFLRDELDVEYGDKTELVYCCDLEDAGSTMVSKGALSSRYEAISEAALPAQFGCAVLQRAYANAEDHPDLFYKSRRANNKVGWITIVKDGKNRLVKLAKDRLRIVMNQGSFTGSIKDNGILEEYFTPIDDPTISATFCWLDGTFKDHECALADGWTWENELADGLQPSSDTNALKPGVHYWDRITAKIDAAQLRNHAAIVKDAEGNDCFFFNARLSIKYEGDRKITVKWTIMGKPGEAEKEAFSVESQDLWNADFSEFTKPEIRAAEIGSDVLMGGMDD